MPSSHAEGVLPSGPAGGTEQVPPALPPLSLAKERAHLAMTLRDAKSVIATLERLLGCLIHTLFIFFYLAIFSVSLCAAQPLLTLLLQSSRPVMLPSGAVASEDQPLTPPSGALLLPAGLRRRRLTLLPPRHTHRST